MVSTNKDLSIDMFSFHFHAAVSHVLDGYLCIGIWEGKLAPTKSARYDHQPVRIHTVYQIQIRSYRINK